MKKPRAPKSETDKDKGGPDQAAAHLSSDEHALWRHVTGNVAPIKAKSRVRRSALTADAARPVPTRKAAHGHHVRGPAEAAHLPGDAARAHAKQPAKPSPPPLVEFDPRKAKHLSRGRIDVEARLDLHGLRQDEAHARLRHFLFDCHARALKTVLVITGKGRIDDDRSTPFSETLDRHPRGVLRRNVPQWLTEPDLRGIVVSFTSAAIKHGGDGAFYVQLRRQQR